MTTSFGATEAWSLRPHLRSCSGRTAAVLVAVSVGHLLPQSRRADTDVLDVHVDFYAGDAHTCASRAQGKAKPPGISAIPRPDIYVADNAHYPNRRPRPKCSVRTSASIGHPFSLTKSQSAQEPSFLAPAVS